MTDPAPTAPRKQFSISKKVYWLLILLLPLGWWIRGDGSGWRQRAPLAAIAILLLLLAAMVGWFSKIYLDDDQARRAGSGIPAGTASKKSWFSTGNVYWLILFPLSVVWWIIAGNKDPGKSVLFAAASLAAFAVGGMAGFVFSSFGEELATFGKIRDWIIAGITGATLVELAEQGGVFRKVLLNFVPSEQPGEFGLTISMAVVYFSLGFFFMFLQRELLLNILLAKSRAERGRLDGTQQTGIAIQKLLAKLPSSVLTGVDDVDAVLKPQEAEELRKLLDQDDVKLFLAQAEDALKDGQPLDWDTVSKVAYVYYYKVYCTPDPQKKTLVQDALHWIRRALVFVPMHVDLTMKYADMEMIDEDYPTAVSILDQIVVRDDAPAYAKQWLGYALLKVPDRLRDSIRFSEEYLRDFPETSEALFNIALAYAKLYCSELRKAGITSRPDSENHKKALSNLDEALRRDPDYRQHVQENYSAKGASFECMDKDPEYRRIVWPDNNHHKTRNASEQKPAT
jgi:tetratricopeptide (TPR) repeat protein